jgi:surface antigen
MKPLLLNSVLVLSLSGCLGGGLMPSGINPTLGCSPILGCTSKDYYIPGRGVRAPKSNGITKSNIGAIAGAGLGAMAGAGKSPVVAAAYSVAGLVVGYTVGDHFDKVDQIHATMLLKQTLSNNSDGQMSNWTNNKKGFVVTQGPVATKGNCREFVSNVAVGKEFRKLRGTACLENKVWALKNIY